MLKQGTNVMKHKGAGNLFNAILDGVLIFPLGLVVNSAGMPSVL
jgi:hypothetical protein